jgi:hypothetical protein
MPARRSSSGRAAATKGSSVRVDLSKVETRKKVEEGEYEVVVAEVTQEEGQKAPYLKWKFKIDEGTDSDGGVLYLNTSLSEQSLWNLKTLLDALGVDIPEDEFDLDLEELVDQRCMVSVELETWEGKKQPRVVDFWAVEKKDDKKKPANKDKTDEKSPPARGKRKTKPEPEEKDKLTQDQINDMDEGELEDIVKDYDLDVDLDKFRTLRKKQTAVIDAAEKAEMLSDDE